MNVAKTPEMDACLQKVNELEAQLRQARDAYKYAVLKSHEATGSLQVGDVVLYRGKKARISMIAPSRYCLPEVKLFVRKQLKSGEFGNQDFEVWASLDSLKKVEA